VGDAIGGALVLVSAATILAGALLVARAALPRLPWRRGVQFRREPIPEGWSAIVDHNVPLASGLSSADRQRLLQLVQVFLHDKRFEGCGGLEITEQMKVIIAAHACMLLLHLDGPCYPRVNRILVYPSTFVPKFAPQSVSMHVEPIREPLAGEAWGDGVVVLSWSSVRDGASPREGDNVVLHEFAHELDYEDGAGGGTPILESPSLLKTWAHVLSVHYEQLRRDARQHRPTVLNAYGATNLSEFFAVATETFFEKPRQLRNAEPDLYEELKAYYRQDPATRA
jgi:MtfA peptidase